MALEFEITQIGEPAEFCVIWLHGLGADGHDFVPIVPELGLADSPGIRFIFPHAPHQAVTINNGYVMRAWYDVLTTDLTEEQDQGGIAQSSKLIENIIDAQINDGIPPEKIILAGFSQGGAMALHIGLRSTYKLAGIMALSAYLPLAKQHPLKQAQSPIPPIFMAHGNYDAVIPIQAAIGSKTLLESLGYSVLWKEYPMEHSVCGEEVQDIGQWLKNIVSANG